MVWSLAVSSGNAAFDIQDLRIRYLLAGKDVVVSKDPQGRFILCAGDHRAAVDYLWATGLTHR